MCAYIDYIIDEIKQTKRTSFYIAASDKALLTKVGHYLTENGYMFLNDASGNIQLIIDGRKGYYHAAKQIEETALSYINEKTEHYNIEIEYRSKLIHKVLNQYLMPKHLVGYRYLYKILFIMVVDHNVIRPLSKSIYPRVSKLYGVSTEKLCRSLRYFTKNLYLLSSKSIEALPQNEPVLSEYKNDLLYTKNKKTFSNTQLIYYLYDEIMSTIEKQTNLPSK